MKDELSDDPAGQRPRGCLYLIGGAEDRGEHKRVLGRLVQIAGGPGARIVLLTAASRHQAEVRDAYEAAFAALGVAGCEAVTIDHRDEADDPARAGVLLGADVVFMTGGDQRRLAALVGGTRVEQAIHRALHERGACVAGTSAGAAAMSLQMLSDGAGQDGPSPGGPHVSRGLGLLPGVVIDQHFTQRQRLGRLLAVIAHHPGLLGLGIDEDTALHIQPGRGLEVVGGGAVTLVDGGAPGTAPADTRRHELPAGTRWQAGAAAGTRGPAALDALLARVVNAAHARVQAA